MAATLGDQLGAQLMNAVKIVEEQVENEIKAMDNMGEDDYEAIRKRRLEELKRVQAKKQEMMANGHGKYEEVPDEKAFFDATKKSDKVVCLFYTSSSFRCKIVDKHLDILARKHVGTRFIKIDAEKAVFLSTRLNIRVIPTIAVILKQNTADYIRGFDDLGGIDDFKTEVLERRLARSQVLTIPDRPEPKKEKKIIRCGTGLEDAEDY